MAQNKAYMVKRAVTDGHASGSDNYAFLKVVRPNPGEPIYHGRFVKGRPIEHDNGPMGSTYTEVYVPVDETELTTEPFDGGDEVETF